MIGMVLGDRYELEELVGKGGMAYVYKAKDLILKRKIAVKILKEQFEDDEEFVRKFEMEAQSAARLTHANIVSVYDVGQDTVDGKSYNYIVMEYIDGKTLKEIIDEEGHLSNEDIKNYSEQLANALECAHENGIIHRDIKPQNIMVTKDNTIKVTDFGIARLASSATITYTSSILGTVHYISPEQAKGQKVDEKSDLYSMGVVMYEMATGKLPFDAENAVGIAIKHIQDDPIPPKEINPDLTDKLNDLILKLMSKEPKDRIQSAREISNILKSKKEWDETLLISTGSERLGSSSKKAQDREDQEKAVYNTNKREKNDDENEKGNKRKKRDWLLPLILGLIVGLILVFGNRIVGNLKNEADMDIVPNVEGLEEDLARQILEEKGFKVEILGEEESKTIAKGRVISQAPRPNTSLEKGSSVGLTISSGLKMVNVPKLVGLKSSDVDQILAGENLEKGVVHEKNDDSVEEGYVISQSPEEGDEVESGTSVDITVSLGTAVKMVKMPDLIGKTQLEAIASLSSAGLSIGEISQREDPQEAGRVVFQSRVKGMDVPLGSTVDITLSLGQKKAETETENADQNNSERQGESGNKAEYEFRFSPPDKNQETYNVKILRLNSDGSKSEIYNKDHNTEDGDSSTSIVADKGTKFEVYINDQLYESKIN